MIVFVFLFYQALHAIEFVVEDPCLDKELFYKEVESNKITVGNLTLDVLNTNGIEFAGSDRGIKSINKTPVGLDSYDIISNSEMFVYGWCYSVNESIPEKYPHEIFVSDNDRIRWWFGFAYYLNGEWFDQCKNSNKRRLKKYCESF